MFEVFIFFLTLWGFGFAATSFLKTSDSGPERFVTNIGIGMAVFLVVGFILNLIRIPLNGWLLLFVSLAGPLCYLIVQYVKTQKLPFNFKTPKLRMDILILVLILGFVFFMHYKGISSYSWLENGDPWIHGTGVRYIAQEQTLFVPEGSELLFRYIDAYPPGYDFMLAYVYQFSDNLIWSMKLTNVLIILIGIAVFYFFAKRFMGSSKKALLATFVLAAVPAYFSHFIWAHSLVVALLFPALYAVEMMSGDKNWAWLAGIIAGSTMLVQHTQPFKFFVMFVVYAFFKIFFKKESWKLYLKILLIGLVVSMLWWGPMMLKYKGGFVEAFTKREGGEITKDDKRVGGKIFGALGSGTRMYTFEDFFIAKKQGLFTAPVGLGMVVTLLLAVGILFLILNPRNLVKEENIWKPITLLWFVFTLAGLYGGTVFPISLFSFRFWLLISIPVALLVAEGTFGLIQKGKKYSIPGIIILLVVVGGIFYTSAIPKYALNTSEWPPEPGMVRYGQFGAYEFMADLPKNTKVLNLCHYIKFGDHQILSYDLDACPWCKEELAFRGELVNIDGFAKSPQEINSFAKTRGYGYIYTDFTCVDLLKRTWRIEFNHVPGDAVVNEATQNFINGLANAGIWQVAHNTQGSVLFKV